MPAGLHIVRKNPKSGPPIWYVYAWRGGPCIDRTTGERPKITAALTDKAADERRKLMIGGEATIAGLIRAYRASPEWTRTAQTTRTSWLTWLDRITEKFGKTPLRLISDRRFRGVVLDWRDQWADRPRSADMAMQVFGRLINWGVDRGKVPVNVLSGIDHLYDHDRSDIIWEPHHFAAFNAVAAVELREAVELAALTGLRRGDLVRLPWTAIGAHAIVWKTAKSRGRNLVTIPLLPETRALLDSIRKRHADTMAKQRPDRRKPLPETVLSNSYWRSWTPTGLGSRVHDFKTEAKIDVHLHDLRGTFATRCMIAGLNDQEIADILGWATKDVAAIRVKYVDQARVVVAIGERIARGGVNRL